MDITVIIAHDEDRVELDLDALKCECYQQMADMGLEGEILIETDGSKSSARNKAVDKSKGNLLLFLDDDIQLRRDFFVEILEPFSMDQDVGIVGGVNLAFPGISGREEISASMMSSPFLWGKSCARYTPRGGIRKTDESELTSCCMAVRKEAFLEAEGFPLDVIPCEENFLINRIQENGWIAIYNPFAIVYHRRALFPGGYARKLFDYGKGRGLMMRYGVSKGAPRALWKPRLRWLAYFLGFFIHFGSYFSGVIYGYFVKGRKIKRWKQK